jgi:chromate reductase
MADANTLNVLGISGSLRKGSYNTRVLHIAKSLAPAGMNVEIWQGFDKFPLYNFDEHQASGIPPAVQDLIARIRAAHGVLVVTPEYNFSMPGGFKNAIDWASRGEPQPFAGKPICVMGAAMGPLGTGRAQYDLRRTFVFLDAVVMNKPEVFVNLAHTKFDEQGNFKDEVGRGIIKQAMENFAAWIRKHG